MIEAFGGKWEEQARQLPDTDDFFQRTLTTVAFASGLFANAVTSSQVGVLDLRSAQSTCCDELRDPKRGCSCVRHWTNL